MGLTGETACATTFGITNHRPPCSKTHKDTHTLVFYRHFEAPSALHTRSAGLQTVLREEKKRKNKHPEVHFPHAVSHEGTY